jgi:MFS family permease
VRALQHRNFRFFAGGQLISLIGTWMDSVAESWLVYRLTGSSVLLGFIGFSSQIPVFLLAPVGGTVADRHDRRKLLIATQAASMFLAGTLAALTLSGRVRVWQIFALAALLGAVNSVDIPTRQAFVIDLVGREDLINAIALNSSMFNGARIVGPAVAGVLVATIGEGWCFFANAVSYLAVIAGLILIRLPPRGARRRGESMLTQIAEAVGFVRGAAPVRTLLVLLGVISFLGMPYAVLMPIFADRILHSGARGLGILMGASGAGALVGSVALALRRGLKGLGSWVAFATVAFGTSLVLFSSSRHFWLSAAFLLPVGFSFMVAMAASNTLIQSMVPDALRGRVMALYSMMFMGMAPFGSLLAGSLAHHIGAPRTVAVNGGLCAVAGLVFRWKLPRLRSEARELIVASQGSGGEPAHAIGNVPAVEPG